MEGCSRGGLFRLHVIVFILSIVRLSARTGDIAHHQGLRRADRALKGAGFLKPRRRAPIQQALLVVHQEPATTTAAAAAVTTPAGLLVPLPNDTISEEYWGKVNSAIYKASLTTPEPKTLNDAPPTPEPEPFKKIFQASQTIEVADTPQASESLNDWHTGSLETGGVSSSGSGAGAVRKVGVVPYDMQLGARILYGMSPKNPEKPLPTQDYINEAFVAKCPLVMFGSALEVRAPRCGSSLGEWADPATDRNIVRWSANSKGGLSFNVDSAVSGNGSVLYADLNEKLTFNKYKFELLNCLGTPRYVVEEDILKVNSAGGKAYASDDTSVEGTSFFYRYSILNPDGTGTSLADTGLIRMDQNEVNFTESNEGLGTGRVVATASRTGEWTRDGWRTCDGIDRGWMLTFPTEPGHFSSAASIQDLRVASAVAITLMAFRDESVGYDGFQHVGQGYLYWQLVRTAFWIFFALLVASIVWVVWTRKAWDKKLWKFLSKVEAVFLPKRPAQPREKMAF